MTTTTTTMTKIVCGECRHENEAERIYCHNCGERLDRSAAAAQKPIVDPTETHRRLQKMLGPPSRVRHNFFAVSKLVLAAVAAAATSRRDKNCVTTNRSRIGKRTSGAQPAGIFARPD